MFCQSMQEKGQYRLLAVKAGQFAHAKGYGYHESDITQALHDFEVDAGMHVGEDAGEGDWRKKKNVNVSSENPLAQNDYEIDIVNPS